MKKKINIRPIHIVLGTIIVVGTTIITLACIILYNLLLTSSVDASKLTNNFEDFIEVYNYNDNMKDMPAGLVTEETNCVISEDGSTFTFTATVKNISEAAFSLSMNVFVGEEFINAYGEDVTNPIMTVNELDNIMLEAGQSYTLTYTGLIFGSGEESVEEFKKNFSYVYLETSFNNNIGRIRLPVIFD